MKEKLINLLKDLMHQMTIINENIFLMDDYKEFLSLCTKDIEILTYIGEHESINAKEISIDKDLPKTTVVSAVSRLEKKGYISKVKNPDDGRQQLLHLTDKGELINKQHLQYENLFLHGLMSLFHEDDYEQLVNILERSKICNTTK